MDLSSTGPLAGSCAGGDPGIPCGHLCLAELGISAGVSYRMCTFCGAVIVLASDGQWIIPAVDPRNGRAVMSSANPLSIQ